MIEKTLQTLGITCNYVGYRQTFLAIRLALENELRLTHITRQIYWVVAETIKCSRCNVERNIRTVIFRAWIVNRPMLLDMAEFPLFAPPSVSQFLAIMITYLKKAEMKSQSK